MAIRYQLIRRPPAAVWKILKRPSSYADWVVGTDESAPREGRWPEQGSSLSYTIKLGPRRLDGWTVVRRYEPPRYLELEAHAPFGTARIAIDVREWGDETLVIVDEHPLRGLGGKLHNVVLDSVIQLRHRDMLARLARLVERETPRKSAEDDGRKGSRPAPSAGKEASRE
ncbi:MULTISPECIES: SRPBCC family protein [unclassified Streptomyces]|uniref:SRPBCC family protein n=1 Tax=unclassified Streptomyces TaxID=2593676 RepID=UPI002E2DC1BB|nr:MULTISPECIES: SRPBCC family protein [unclassified Streptomyces]WUB89962.1 SRPBCC family protein [Streptomyces sp. NBC_00566]